MWIRFHGKLDFERAAVRVDGVNCIESKTVNPICSYSRLPAQHATGEKISAYYWIIQTLYIQYSTGNFGCATKIKQSNKSEFFFAFSYNIYLVFSEMCVILDGGYVIHNTLDLVFMYKYYYNTFNVMSCIGNLYRKVKKYKMLFFVLFEIITYQKHQN